MVSVHIAAAGIVGSHDVAQLTTALQESMQSDLLKQSAIRFGWQHDVSVQIQIQVTYSLLETRAARSMQRQFQRLMRESLPDKQRRQVSEELWSTRLLTFGLDRAAMSEPPQSQDKGNLWRILVRKVEPSTFSRLAS